MSIAEKMKKKSSAARQKAAQGKRQKAKDKAAEEKKDKAAGRREGKKLFDELIKKIENATADGSNEHIHAINHWYTPHVTDIAQAERAVELLIEEGFDAKLKREWYERSRDIDMPIDAHWGCEIQVKW